jgi:hypothetical protein
VIQRIALPFGHEVLVCDICGYSGASEGQMLRCTEALPPDAPDIAVGDVVQVYGRRFNGGGSCMRTADREAFTVRFLCYRQPEHPGFQMALALAASIGGAGKDPEKPAHRIELQLAQNSDGSPWTPESNGGSLWTLEYGEFLLWREGDEAKLAAASLIRPPAPVRKRWWPKLFQ